MAGFLDESVWDQLLVDLARALRPCCGGVPELCRAGADHEACIVFAQLCFDPRSLGELIEGGFLRFELPAWQFGLLGGQRPWNKNVDAE